MQRKGNTFTLLVGMQTGTATLENSMYVPHKVKKELPYNPVIALLGISQRYKNADLKGTCNSSIINNRQTMERA